MQITCTTFSCCVRSTRMNDVMSVHISGVNQTNYWQLNSNMSWVERERKTHLFSEATRSRKPSPANCTSSRRSCCLTCPVEMQRRRRRREEEEEEEEEEKKESWERKTDGVKRGKERQDRRGRFGHWVLDPDAQCTQLFVLVSLCQFTHTHRHTHTHTQSFHSFEWAGILLSVLRGVHLKGN